MQTRVLIFGASGFVGAYLAREFHEHKYEVFGSDLARADSVPEYVVFRPCNLLDADAVADIVRAASPTHIVNLAAISSVALSWKIPQKTVAVNVEGAINILEAARLAPERPKVLLIGSSEEYAVTDQPIGEECAIDANNPYGLSKALQERFSELYRDRYGLDVYRVRSFNHTGVGQSDAFVVPGWCKQAANVERSGKPGVIRVGNLKVKRDFSHVRDIVRAYRMILESEDCKAIYNVGSGKAIAMEELLSYIFSLSSQPIRIDVDPALFRPSDNPFIQCDSTLIRNQLGWKPEYTVFDAAKELFEMYLKGMNGR